MLFLKLFIFIFLTVIPDSLVEELQKIQKKFIWRSSRPKINRKTLSNNLKNGGLKHVHISSKIISLQWSWLLKLCDENFHKWKIIPSHIINKYFGKSFKLHSCLSFDCKLLIKFPEFYIESFWYWETKFKSVILSPCIHPSLYPFIELVKTDSFDWKQIYLLPRLVNHDIFSFLSIQNTKQYSLFR